MKWGVIDPANRFLRACSKDKKILTAKVIGLSYKIFLIINIIRKFIFSPNWVSFLLNFLMGYLAYFSSCN